MNYEDLAGLSYNLCTAINELTDHHAVSIGLISNWIRYPYMINGKKAVAEALPQLLRDADVLHINERPRLLRTMGAKPEEWRGKKVIYHFHGSRFKRYYPQTIESVRSDFPDVVYVVSTPDLLRICPEATWFPPVISIERYRQEHGIQRNDPPVLYGAHTKPNRHQPILKKVTEQLLEEGLEFEVRLVSRKTHSNNLRLKAQTDIYLDGIRSFYGIDVLEASAFGIPSVTNMDQYSKEYMQKHEVNCPYMLASNPSELKEIIRQLVLDPSLREEKGGEDHEYVKRMHSPEVGVERFLEMIE
ncbi:hypothetical protein KAR91_73070 [Candidatus Pacearchaeota archaeon]|nr:hypothetical protein [Candidatus Pacearchaeota archaeon]